MNRAELISRGYSAETNAPYTGEVYLYADGPTWNLFCFAVLDAAPDVEYRGTYQEMKSLKDAFWERVVSHSTQSSTRIRLDTIDAPESSIDFASQQALSFRVENRTSDPGSPTVGQIWIRTDL